MSNLRTSQVSAFIALALMFAAGIVSSPASLFGQQTADTPASEKSGAKTTAVPPAPLNVTTSGGTANTLPLFTSISNVQSSAVTQTGSGVTAKIGINTVAPVASLDVHGSAAVRGTFTLPAIGVATSAGGKASQPEILTTSVFNSGTGTAVNQNFRWQAEPASNNTAVAAGSLNLLFSSGSNPPTETGFRVAGNGRLTFATGQTFPGTVSSVTARTALIGYGTQSNVIIDLDTTMVPLLNASNSFFGDQAVRGDLITSGSVSGDAFRIGSDYFAFGYKPQGSVYLGFAGNIVTTATFNTLSE